jgi:hypothetical protein
VLFAIGLNKKLEMLIMTEPINSDLIVALYGLLQESIENIENKKTIDTLIDTLDKDNSLLIPLDFTGMEEFNNAIRPLLPGYESDARQAIEKIVHPLDDTGGPPVVVTGDDETNVERTEAEAAAAAEAEAAAAAEAEAAAAAEAEAAAAAEAEAAAAAEAAATPVVVPDAPVVVPDATVVQGEQQGESMTGKSGGRRYKSKTRRKTRRTRRRRRTRKTNRKKRKTNRKKRRSNRKTRKM